MSGGHGTASPRLLVVGDLWEHGTCRHRIAAFRRLGLNVETFDVRPYALAGGPLATRLRIRLLAGPAVGRLNRDLLARAAAMRPDIVWCDKPLFIRPATVRALQAGGAVVVNHVLDNPFATLPGEPGWRLLRHAIPAYDLHLVPRESSLEDYRRAGAGTVRLMPLAFDPFVHYPRPAAISPGEPDPVVGFVGSPYGGRPAFLAGLAARGLGVRVRGDGWRRRQRAVLAAAGADLGPGVYGEAYREALWSAAVCLGLVTHAHRDPAAHRAFEITGAGAALLAERTEGHAAAFAEDREILLFSDLDEAADKATYLLRHPAARAALAAAGWRRAWSAGYTNDERQAEALAVLDPARGNHWRQAARAVVRARRAALGLEG